MSEELPTPAPWCQVGRAVFAGDREIGLASHPRDTDTAPPDHKFVETYDEAIGNARMFAAAPELLKAVESWLEHYANISDETISTIKQDGSLGWPDEVVDRIIASRAAVHFAKRGPATTGENS